MTMNYVGVDVSNHTLDLATWAEEKAETLGSYANELSGFNDIADQLSKVIKDGQICLVMEPTGSYHLSLVAFAIEQGW